MILKLCEAIVQFELIGEDVNGDPVKHIGQIKLTAAEWRDLDPEVFIANALASAEAQIAAEQPAEPAKPPVRKPRARPKR